MDYTPRRVLRAELGKIGPGRPDDEVWWCWLECGCKDWRPRDARQSRAPHSLKCRKHLTGPCAYVAPPDPTRWQVTE